MPPPLAGLIDRLEALYGVPEPPAVTEPFAMVIQENAAYLVDDERRGAVFARLRDEIGLEPEAILGAPLPILAQVIADGGMLPEHRAEKLQTAAAIALEIGSGTLERLLATDPAKALRALKRFPGVGEPGGDRILLFNHVAGAKNGLAPDSNALRTLVRLGYGEEDESYTRQYRSSAAAVASFLPDDFPWRVRAHQLLRLHGQRTCKRSLPLCEICPLRGDCRWYQRSASGG